MKNTRTDRSTLFRGIFQFVWGELKSMNMEKLKGVGNIIAGYVGMKLGKKHKQKQTKAIKQRRGYPTDEDRITYI